MSGIASTAAVCVLLLSGAVGVCGCTRDRPSADELQEIAFAPSDSLIIALDVRGNRPDGIEWFRPSDLRLSAAGGLVALNSGSFQVVQIAHTSASALVEAQRGAGPGEFDRMGQLRFSQRGFWISDPALRRLTEYASDGTVLGVVSAPALSMTGSYAVVGQQIYIATGQGHDHYLEELARSGSIGERAARQGPEQADFLGSSMNQVVAAGEALHILDNDGGILIRFALPSVTATHALQLPAEWHDEVASLRQQAKADLGPNQVAFFPFATVLTVTSRQQLLLLTNRRTGPVGLIVDPRSYTHAAVYAGPPNSRSSSLLGGVVKGDTLFALTESGVLSYVMAPMRAPATR